MINYNQYMYKIHKYCINDNIFLFKNIFNKHQFEIITNTIDSSLILSLCCDYDSYNIIKYLMEETNFNFKKYTNNKNYNNILQYLCVVNKFELFKLLYKKSYTRNILVYVLEHGTQIFIDYVFKNSSQDLTKKDKYGRYILPQIFNKCDCEILQFIIYNYPIDINFNYYDSLN